jgi:hypothetical protein
MVVLTSRSTLSTEACGWRPDGCVRGRKGPQRAAPKSPTDVLVTWKFDVGDDDANAQFTATKTIKGMMNTGAAVY